MPAPSPCPGRSDRRRAGSWGCCVPSPSRGRSSCTWSSYAAPQALGRAPRCRNGCPRWTSDRRDRPVRPSWWSLVPSWDRGSRRCREAVSLCSRLSYLVVTLSLAEPSGGLELRHLPHEPPQIGLVRGRLQDERGGPGVDVLLDHVGHGVSRDAVLLRALRVEPLLRAGTEGRPCVGDDRLVRRPPYLADAVRARVCRQDDRVRLLDTHRQRLRAERTSDHLRRVRRQ